MLGRQEVGKTHLWQRLLFDKIAYVVTKTQSWQAGVVLMGGTGPAAEDVPLRLFDLGGDPDLHGAHQTFLGDRRNLYIIVCNGSSSRREALLDYWMRVVRAYGTYPHHVPEEDGRNRFRCAPSVVIVSFRDKQLHSDFAGLTLPDSSRTDISLMDVEVVPDYWEPEGRGARAPSGLLYAERLEAVRAALRRAIGKLHDQLSFGYRAGTLAALPAPVRRPSVRT